MSEKTIIAKTKDEWRKWLSKNYEKEKKVALISYKKHTGISSLSHREAMEEAICFGWIDTTIKRLDEDRFIRNFVKRGPNANWSKNTLSYGKQLLKEGRMTPAGIKAYELGLKKKPHDHDETRYDVPKELIDALKKNKKAREFYEKLPPSSKKIVHAMINIAKMKETKDKRLKKIINSFKEGKREF